MPYAHNDGVRIRYEVEGAGSPLVLHVGFVQSLEDWIDCGYVAALRDVRRLVLIDPRGQGQSDKPRDPAAYGLPRRVGDVLAVLDAEGIEHAHFWGYSMGGRVGFAVGLHAPDRLSSLVLGGASPDDWVDASADDDFWLLGFRRGMAALVAEFEEADPSFFASAAERQRWLTADPDALSAARQAILTDQSLVDALPRIDLPALLYCGSEDDPERVARAAEAMPNAAFVALAGLDHAAAINRSDLVLPHVRAFLERVEATVRA